MSEQRSVRVLSETAAKTDLEDVRLFARIVPGGYFDGIPVRDVVVGGCEVTNVDQWGFNVERRTQESLNDRIEATGKPATPSDVVFLAAKCAYHHGTGFSDVGFPVELSPWVDEARKTFFEWETREFERALSDAEATKREKTAEVEAECERKVASIREKHAKFGTGNALFAAISAKE